MMWTLAIFITLCSAFAGSTAGTTSYDQRQNGEFNVQIGLKNLNFIGLLKGAKEEYVDYDYAYDYSEMTIKPQGGTTIKPFNLTTAVTNEELLNASSMTAPLENTTLPTLANSSLYEETTVYLVNNTQTGNFVTSTASLLEDPTTILSSASNTAPPPLTIKRNQCRRGFTRNSEGKCEYKGHGTSNALRRIVKLAQKIKVGRE